MARLLQGKPLADAIAAKLPARVALLRQRKLVPALSVIVAGTDPTARLYMERLRRAGARFAVRVRAVETSSSQAFFDAVDQANGDETVHGIVLLTPLPAEIEVARAVERLDRHKDVEGLHPYNAGRLAIGKPTYVPSTAEAVLLLLHESGTKLAGARAVVVGRSPVVGRPAALLLMAENATVTLAHSGTHQLGTVTRDAEILVVAVGRAGMVTGDMVRPGATVIDAGINATPDGVVGDVDFASASQVASALTPVPGGVGSLTTVLLIRNTIHAAENREP